MVRHDDGCGEVVELTVAALDVVEDDGLLFWGEGAFGKTECNEVDAAFECPME
jgi:hypothetical protein